MASQTEQVSRLFTVAEYHAMGKAGIFGPDERVELVRGVVVPMSPKSLAHTLATQQIFLFFHTALSGRAGVYVEPGLPLETLDSEPEPDVLVCSSPDLTMLGSAQSSPLLTIEVASSSLRYDLRDKAKLYAEAGVPEYWVVNLVERALIVLRGPVDGAYASRTVHVEGTRVSPLSWPDVEVDVSALLPDPSVAT